VASKQTGCAASAILQIRTRPCLTPTAWWTGDDTTDDAIGDLDGERVPEDLGYAPAHIRQGFRFDGDGEGIVVADTPLLDMSLAAGVSLMAWVKVDAEQPARYPFIAGKAADGDLARSGNGAYAIVFNTDLDQFNCRFYTTHTVSTGSQTLVSPIAVDDFAHVACVHDGETARMYINGELDIEIPASGAILDTTGDFVIGNFAEFEWSNDLAGVVDEVRLYDWALSADDVGRIARDECG
jgi:hypothetical protein